jgi:dCTP deaminase
MLLSYGDLVQLVKNEVVEGTDVSNVNGTSIDVRLGPTILVENVTDASDPPVDFSKKEPLSMTKVTMSDDGYILYPGEAILAETIEVFNLPSYISADFRLKSSGARCLLESLHASWCDPLWTGSVLTLQLVNMSRHHKLLLKPGIKIGQMIFTKVDAVPMAKSYAVRGQYNNNKEVSQSRGVK